MKSCHVTSCCVKLCLTGPGWNAAFRSGRTFQTRRLSVSLRCDGVKVQRLHPLWNRSDDDVVTLQACVALTWIHVPV